MKSSVPAVILCGGLSSRMGQPKHLLDLGSGPVWKMMLNELEKSFDSIYISCREDQLHDFVNQNVIIDRFESIGPMGGIISVFQKIALESIFFIGCDLPFFRIDMARELISANHLNLFATCASGEGSDYPEPIIAVWNKCALGSLLEAVSNEDYSLVRLLRKHDYYSIEYPEHYLQNLNTPEDLARARSADRSPQ
ncbi:MAG: molybdenum cofactor guanylyltransferase [Flavobacteriales bacterium]